MGFYALFITLREIFYLWVEFFILVQRPILLYTLFFCFPIYTFAQEARTQFEDIISKCNQLISEEQDSLALHTLKLGLIAAEEKFGKTDTTTSKFYHKIGVANYNLGYWDEAIANYKIAYKIRSEILSPDHPNIAELHYLMGVYYYDLESDSTRYHLNRAIAIQQKNPSSALGRSYMFLADYYLSISDSFNALNYYNLAKNLLQETLPQAEVHMRIADAYSELNEPDSILYYLKKTQSLYESIDLGSYHTLRLSDCYVNLAYYYISVNNYKTARTFLNKAKSIYSQEADNYVGMTNVLINLGIIEKRENNLEKANEALYAALEIYEEEFPNIKHADKGIIHHNLGDNKILLGQIKPAISEYQKASENFIENYEAKGLYSVPDIAKGIFITEKNNVLVNFQQLIAALKQDQETNTKESIKQSYLAIDQVIDKMRQDQVNEDSKLFWRSKTRPIYEQMLKMAYANKDPELAYQVIEKSKSIILLDALKDETALRIANVPDALIQELNTIELELSDLEINIHDYEDRNEVLNAIHNNNTKKQDIISKLERTYPQYYNYKYNSSFVTLEELRKNIINEQTAIVQYFVGAEYMYKLYITTEDIELYRSPINTNLNTNIVQLIQLLSDKNKLEYNNNYKQFNQIRSTLYDELLGDFKHFKESLIIVPDGVINNIPFEILGENEGNQLIDKCNISYAHSCNVLQQNNNEKTHARNQIAFFAPLEYAHSNLSALEGGIEEAKQIKDIIDLKSFIGQDASVRNFKTESSNYNILHLSTHAQANDSLENQSWIAFSDSLLYLDQIYSLPINADLIVLSACQTSLGNLAAGEGVMSLARAFTYAGASSSLTSLWEVNEKASQELIQYFYQEINQGKSRSQALRSAKSKYQEINPNASPHFWSGFILLGNPNEIAIGNISSAHWTLGLVFLLLGTILIFLYKKHTRVKA